MASKHDREKRQSILKRRGRKRESRHKNIRIQKIAARVDEY
jgi:hypothetical protein